MAFKKKMVHEEKGSRINSPELTDILRDIQENFEKSRKVYKENTHSFDKSKAGEMRLKSLETFGNQGSGWRWRWFVKTKTKKGKLYSETFAFLMSTAETESEHKDEKLRLKAKQLVIQKQEIKNQSLLLTQQHQPNNTLF